MRTTRARQKGAVATRGVLSDLGVFAAVAALFAVHAWARVEGTLVGYRLSRAQAEQHELARENGALRLELATRRAARRIEAEARGRLGMVEPRPEAIIPVGAAPEARASR